MRRSDPVQPMNADRGEGGSLRRSVKNPPSDKSNRKTAPTGSGTAQKRAPRHQERATTPEPPTTQEHNGKPIITATVRWSPGRESSVILPVKDRRQMNEYLHS